MRIICFKPQHWEHWMQIHWAFHENPQVQMQFQYDKGELCYGHIVACHPELLRFSVLVDQ